LNIVFDLGGVLFTWKPREIIKKYFTTQAEQDLVFDRIHNHSDWLDLDRGTLTYKEAAKRGEERTGIPADRIETYLNGVPSALQPVPETVALLKRIKSAGNKTYLLSNMHEPSMKVLEKYDFMELFDGKLYSCEHFQVKPDREIYETLLTKFKLKAGETVFVDDTPENLIDPGKLGIKTVLFNNPDQCERELKAFLDI
jgi:putative hydrolase of the HAD superfamily